MGAFQRIGRQMLDTLLPPQCFGCGEPVAEPGRLCAACFAATDFIGDPMCVRCGLPFDFATEAGRICGACAAISPEFDSARAAVRYGEPLRGALLRFKHGDRTDMAVGWARLLARAGESVLEGADMIAPVPLHRFRLWRRLYNQSALISAELALRRGLDHVPDLLERTRRTRTQGGLSATARRRNVRGAFAVNPGRAASVRGARVVLVDDVYTTGATVEACARVLKRSGAESVDILAVARVVRAAAPH